jgi:phage-related protein
MFVAKITKTLSAYFYRNDNGKMPVREWILGFSPEDKKIMGEDIKTVEFGWPIGMPTVRPMGNKLFEVRSGLTDGSDARIFFTIYKSTMVLLHSFLKTTKKTPQRDLRLARNRLKKFLQDPDM